MVVFFFCVSCLWLDYNGSKWVGPLSASISRPSLSSFPSLLFNVLGSQPVAPTTWEYPCVLWAKLGRHVMTKKRAIMSPAHIMAERHWQTVPGGVPATLRHFFAAFKCLSVNKAAFVHVVKWLKAVVGVPPSNDVLDRLICFLAETSKRNAVHLWTHSARWPWTSVPAGFLQIRLWIWVESGRGSALIWSPQPVGRINVFLSLLLDRPSLQRTAHLSRKRSHLRNYLCLFTLTWAEWFLLCEVTSIDWQVPPIQTRFLFQAGSAQIGQARFTRAFTVFGL